MRDLRGGAPWTHAFASPRPAGAQRQALIRRCSSDDGINLSSKPTQGRSMRKNLSQWQLQSRSPCTGHEEDYVLSAGTWDDQAMAMGDRS